MQHTPGALDHKLLWRVPKIIPARPGEDDGGWGEFDRDLYDNPRWPAYWWVRHFHLLKRLSTDGDVADDCRDLAHWATVTSRAPDEILGDWIHDQQGH